MKKITYEIWGKYSGYITDFTTLPKAKKHMIMIKEFDETEYIIDKYYIIKCVETDNALEKTIIYAE